MSATELRQASETLRERAKMATAGPWVDTYPVECCDECGGPGVYSAGGCVVVEAWQVERRDAAYIAATHPGVGLALADVLASCADNMDRSPGEKWDVIFALEFRLARLINGGGS